MELMTDALGLGTFFSGFLLIAAKDNQPMLDLLGVKDHNQLSSCLQSLDILMLNTIEQFQEKKLL